MTRRIPGVWLCPTSESRLSTHRVLKSFADRLRNPRDDPTYIWLHLSGACVSLSSHLQAQVTRVLPTRSEGIDEAMERRRVDGYTGWAGVSQVLFPLAFLCGSLRLPHRLSLQYLHGSTAQPMPRPSQTHLTEDSTHLQRSKNSRLEIRVCRCLG
jgi:hypothetical protein